jgi:2-haloacid dehalogenase
MSVRALVFDIFGTVVDWRGSIVREGEATGITIDWGRFADRWRANYAPSMQRVRTGELPWTKLDALHRATLEDLIAEFGLGAWSAAEREHFNHVWHRLAPWPDSCAGLKRLRQRYVLATLSNGNVSLLVDLVRHGALPFDTVLSAELFRHYKPDPEVYGGARELLGDELMLVAAHVADLRAARACGLRTAFVARPFEHGPAGRAEEPLAGEFDYVARDLEDLATQLGC